MRTRKLLNLLLFLFLLIATQASFAAQGKIQLTFQIDGKQVKPEKSAVIFHAQGGSYLAIPKKGMIEVPSEVANQPSVDVQVVWDKYSVIFSGVDIEFLRGKWTIGADWPPIENESLRSAANMSKELVILFFLEMDTNDLPKQIVVEVTK